ncbi:MAG: hypothetical protein Q9197_001525 [Variospora fuerteventurae]
MALATLCYQLRKLGHIRLPGLSDIRLQAFIVDHKARPESTREARQVVNFLDKILGLNANTEVLPLHWPPGVIPSELPNFETEARRLRYQALGKACYKANIPTLLLGHHRADGDETVLMRLVAGYRGEGLRGVSGKAEIPYCTGVYGAFQSGGRDYTVPSKETQQVEAQEANGQQRILDQVKFYHEQGFEYGGVKIYRPLMDYSKPELEATLKAAGVPWVTDPTNQDPTLSIRNAIRYLTQQRLLPKALDSGSQKEPSPLSMASSNIRRKYQRRNEQAALSYQACDIISFDARSGHLQVRIPIFPAHRDPDFHLLTQHQQLTEVEHIAARLVRLLLSIVSPCDNISLQTLKTATWAMFGNLQEGPQMGSRPKRVTGLRPSKFTAGGVLCERIEMRSEETPLPGAHPFSLDPDSIWCLSREPYIKRLAEPVCIVPPAVTPPPPPSWRGEKKKGVSRTAFSEEPEWQLWDRRYWIQVLNPTDTPLEICPLSRARLDRIIHTEKEDSSRRRLLKKTLRSVGPPHVRYTLPAITDMEGHVLALPTVGFVSQALLRMREDRRPRWRVRFKNVVFPEGGVRMEEERVVKLDEGGIMEGGVCVT